MAGSHQHRTTTKQSHKPFKPRFASKGALKDAAKGKIESRREDRTKRRTPHQQVMSKMARRNQAKQLRMHHREKQEDESSIFQGREGVPKHVAVVPLSSKICVTNIIEQLNDSVGVTQHVAGNGTTKTRVDRFRRNLLYIPTQFSLLSALDTCRLADWVIFVLSSDQVFGEDEDQFIRALEGQGITNVMCVLQVFDQIIPSAKRSKMMAQLKSEMNRYFPSIDKLYALDNQADSANVVRSLCISSAHGIRWRDARSWMLIENLEWMVSQSDDQHSNVALTGIVRGKPLNPDRLVHVPGWGDFQIGRVTELVQQRNPDEQHSIGEGKRKEFFPSSGQDDLLDLAPEEVDMEEAKSTEATDPHKGVLLDDHHYFSDDNSHIPPAPKRLPKGTSTYQAAWYLEDVSDSGSDLLDDQDENSDMELDNEVTPGAPEDGLMMPESMELATEAGMSEYPESEMHVDRSLDEEVEALESFRRSRKTAEDDDLEFQDEIELPPNMLARDRLARYRGLRNLRTSEWNTEADSPHEPSEYQRLLAVADYQKSRNAAVREALVGPIPAGMRVEIEILKVPGSLGSSSKPIAMFSLLRHEHKSTVVNLNLTLSSKVSEPLKSKEELMVQIGPRRFAVNPVFSAAGNTPNNVHKFDRFLHPGRTAIATFVAPLTWGSVPTLVFKNKPTQADAPPQQDAITEAGVNVGEGECDISIAGSSSKLRLVGSATTVPVSSSRVIVKRVILTGHPFKIHKKLVTIRYMFFNKEDVAWFSALPLWTRRGRQGFVKESLGTHGYFKATFDGKMNPMDAVGVSLYKRIWPRPARMWSGS